MQELTLNQSQVLRQEQTLRASQIQSLDLLMAPALELQTKITQELETNPILELEKEDSVELQDPVLASNVDAAEVRVEKSIAETGKIEAEQLTEGDAESLFERNETFFDSKYSTGFVNEETREYFFNSIIDKSSIEDDLKSQLIFLDIGEEQRKLCELIIGCLDEQGFFRSSLADLAIIAGVDLEEMERAFLIVKALDPPGVGAKNIQESLLLQLERIDNNKILIEIVEYHLEDIAKNHLPYIAKSLGISLEEVKNAIEKIKKLSPYPYAMIQDNDVSLFIVPEVKITKENNGYTVTTNREYHPRLRLSNKYMKMLENSDVEKETKDYIKDKILSAKNIIRGMEQRQSTIKRIVDVLVDIQYDFLEKGGLYLKPMTMKHIADKIGVHETTVSRAVANKYIDTPQGTFPLKYFFSTGFQLADGDLLASKGVMERIKHIIDTEDPASPYSDDDISEALKNSGIPVARRTVAKYREELNIPSSRLRKEHV